MKARLLRSLIFGLPFFTAARAESGKSDPWRLATNYFFHEARQQASAIPKPTRADRLASAVLLFNVNPVTSAQLDLAGGELQAIADENPDDDAGLAAQYYLGRLAQVQRQTPDLATARRHYETLIARKPQSFFGELAQVKLALIDLYPADHQVPSVEVLDSLDARSRRLTNPLASRDLHLALARAYLFYRQELANKGYDSRPRALEHLHAAESAGTASFRTRAELLVGIGEVSNELGRFKEARSAYTAFVAEYSRDARAGTIRMRLAKLPAVVPR